MAAVFGEGAAADAVVGDLGCGVTVWRDLIRTTYEKEEETNE